MSNPDPSTPEWLEKVRAVNPEEMAIGKVIDQKGEKNGTRPFLRMTGGEVTYRELAEKVRRAASGFLQLGIRQGDKAAIILPNGPEYFYAWFGLCHIGAMMVPVNTALKGEGLQFILDHSDARAVIVHTRFLPSLRPILPELRKIKHLICQRAKGDPDINLPREAILWEDFIQSQPSPSY